MRLNHGLLIRGVFPPIVMIWYFFMVPSQLNSRARGLLIQGWHYLDGPSSLDHFVIISVMSYHFYDLQSMNIPKHVHYILNVQHACWLHWLLRVSPLSQHCLYCWFDNLTICVEKKQLHVGCSSSSLLTTRLLYYIYTNSPAFLSHVWEIIFGK